LRWASGETLPFGEAGQAWLPLFHGMFYAQHKAWEPAFAEDFLLEGLIQSARCFPGRKCETRRMAAARGHDDLNSGYYLRLMATSGVAALATTTRYS
jgi:hypothetical protein